MSASLKALILLAAGNLTACSAIIGNAPFSTLPKSKFGKPEPTNYYVRIAPHPWVMVTPKGADSMDVFVFVQVRGLGWETRGVRLEGTGRIRAARTTMDRIVAA